MLLINLSKPLRLSETHDAEEMLTSKIDDEVIRTLVVLSRFCFPFIRVFYNFLVRITSIPPIIIF